jgi:hypothetical protein
MMDSALLLLAAAACSTAAWTFWHFLGNDAFGIFALLALAVVAVDNLRLRRKLREKRGE